MSLLTSIQTYYKLDGNSTASVGGINGSDTAISYSNANGKINQGAGFNGTTSLIDFGDNFDQSSDFSVSAWVKTSQASGEYSIITKGNVTDGYEWGMEQQTNSLWFVLWNQGGATYMEKVSAATINDGNWHHVVGTYSSATPRVRVYIDGALDGASTATSGTWYSAGTSHCLIGSRNDGSEFWTGSIDEVGIWTRELTAGDVTQLYNGGVGLQYPFTQTSQGFSFLDFM